ncbi:unnamed protein product [Effrenium voratum]|uniref:Calx-beta domain-containing protein n=1 Tax=Effrenium voratum TaxID=2562239 RepID=A0AA36J8G4_9DINO|nr:unnamed protein product [Effrenium voratum]
MIKDFFLDLFDGNLTAFASATLVILGNQDPGFLKFEKEQMECKEELKEVVRQISVMRRDGAFGKVVCEWRTEDVTAQAATHYVAGSGTLEFEHGQMAATIPLTILPAGRYELSSTVRLVLSNITGGKFNPASPGGKDSCMTEVVIEADPAIRERITRIHSALAVNWAKAHSSQSNWRAWKEQIKDAIKLRDDEDDEEPRTGVLSYVSLASTAVLVVPWKLVFSIIPPTGFCDGWCCFVGALMGIGALTAVVGDVAALLGCVMEIGSAITAITLVALGTSLPDTFASRQAAVQDATADASVGNVTGSNSVNVFLGLGLPWSLGAMYWTIGGADSMWLSRYQDKDFAQPWLQGALVVEAGDLAFSVSVFSCCATACVILLAIRRQAFGGELGGPATMAYVSSFFLVGLWALYVGLSCWYILVATRQ